MVCRESDLSRIQLINGNGTSLYIAQNFCLLTSCVPTRFHQFHILFGLFSFAPKESLFSICGDRGYMSNLCTFCLILLWTWNCSKKIKSIKKNLEATGNLKKHLNNFAESFPGGSAVKNLPANAGDPGSIPGSGRSPGEGNGNPLQYSCLRNPTDRGAWRVTVHRVSKSRTWLKRHGTAHRTNKTMPLCIRASVWCSSRSIRVYLRLLYQC